MRPTHRPPILPPRPDPLRCAIRAVIALVDFGSEPVLIEACMDSLERYAQEMGVSTADGIDSLEHRCDQLALGLEREDSRMLAAGLEVLRRARLGERMTLPATTRVRMAVSS